MTLAGTLIRGAQSFRAAVTVDGKEVDGRLFPLGAGGRGIDLVGNKSATYEELYRTQLWVQVVVNRLARSIARLPLKVYVNADEPAERERVREGPLADILARPAPRMGRNAFVQAVVSNVAIHGNFVAVKLRERPGQPPVSFGVTSAAYWSVMVRDREPWYVFAPGNGKPQYFRPEEVLHFHWWGGGNGLWPASGLDSLRTTLMTEDATQRLTIASFENGTRPYGAYSMEGTPPIEHIKAAREQLREVYGGVDNAFKIAILTAGAKWMPMSHTAVESELINLRKLNREEVAAAFNIPPPVIGILDRATFSNITEQHLMEYMDTIQPWTDMIQETIAIQLIADEPLMQGEYAEFDFNAVLAGDPVRRMEVLTKAVGGPFMTANEGRATQNLPPLDDPEATKLRPAANASSGAQEVTSADGNR